MKSPAPRRHSVCLARPTTTETTKRSKPWKIHRIAALFSALCWLSACCLRAGRHLLHLLHPLPVISLRQQKAKPMGRYWLAEENDPFCNDALWEKVFSSMDKKRDRNYDQPTTAIFRSAPWKRLKISSRTRSTRPQTADAEKIRSIEEQIAALAPAEDAAPVLHRAPPPGLRALTRGQPADTARLRQRLYGGEFLSNVP